jgi:hypothetical protein
MIWSIGILLCMVFVAMLLPMEGRPGHRFFMPIEPITILFLSIACFGISMVTYLVDKYSKKK